ncbi:hypothetical protein C2G38_979631 [Gigaspora rosea]|uniref:Sulfotransferase family protein n=1 Tax=Gigaspora rosea TaxID=44941 RepID=A0A397VJD3_9GLOM|nr:hypothetical protein C2G38_979631 [Gigaspora rosea]CAG8676530.1 24573_t:CDS:2 [Gigaspora rosea]
MEDQKPIILWSHPRSLSTVFERPFLQLPQEFHVIHEPFVPIVYANEHKNFEFLNRISLLKSTDPITYVHHLSPILNEILAPHYYNEDKTHTLRVFVKEHAKHFLQVAEGSPLLSKEILSMFKHTFLIRNPEKSVKSFYKAMNATNEAFDKAGVPMSGKIEISSRTFGIKQLRILYDLIKNASGEEIALVDADDLVQDPEKILKKYCEMINVEFKKEMLNWKSVKVEPTLATLFNVPGLDDVWFTNAMQSTGFDKTINNDEEIEYPQSVNDLIDEHKPYYEYLFQYRIKI